MGKIRVAILTEIISPYRIPVFNVLAKDARFSIEVLFLAETESRRAWRIPKEEICFPYRVLKSLIVGRSYQQGAVFLNPGILLALLQENYDCLVIGGYHHPSFWIALLYARAAGKRCLLWSESTLKDRRSNHPIKERFKRFLVRQGSGYIVPGKAQVEYLISLGSPSEPIWLAPNAVDSHFFALEAEKLCHQKVQIKQQLGIDGNVILYVGRLLDDKGIPELIHGFEQVLQVHPFANLMLVGDGPDREKYVNQCRNRGLNRVFFAGFQAQTILPRYYAIADLFVFPTHSDPWGLVLNEAMLAGLPVICSQMAGAADDLVNVGENGFLYDPDDIQSLVKYICLLLEDNELGRRMGMRSRQIVNHYTPERMAQGFAEAILES